MRVQFGLLFITGASVLLLATGCDNLTEEDGISVSGASQTSHSALTLDTLPGTTSLSPYLYDAGSDCLTVYGFGLAHAHCCPYGMAMTGAHLGANIFDCAKLDGGITGTVYWDDPYPCPPTFDCHTRNNMHTCAPGDVMVGYHQEGNVLLCAHPGQAVQSEYVDGNSSDGYMHVCRQDFANPFRYVMSGINASQNRFTCAK